MSATRLTAAAREERDLAMLKAVLEPALREALTPLALRIEALETALAKSRTAYAALRLSLKTEPVAPAAPADGRIELKQWHRALASLRAEARAAGSDRMTWPPSDVRARWFALVDADTERSESL